MVMLGSSASDVIPSANPPFAPPICPPASMTLAFRTGSLPDGFSDNAQACNDDDQLAGFQPPTRTWYCNSTPAKGRLRRAVSRKGLLNVCFREIAKSVSVINLGRNRLRHVGYQPPDFTPLRCPAPCPTSVARSRPAIPSTVRHSAGTSIGATVLSVALPTQGIKFWPQKPPRLPIELIAAMLAAARAPLKKPGRDRPEAGIEQRQAGRAERQGDEAQRVCRAAVCSRRSSRSRPAR